MATGARGMQRVTHPLVSLQHRVGNRAVQRLVASASEGPQDDRTFRNTTLTAHQKAGGKIKKLSETNFATDFAGGDEPLAITGHGDINVVGDYGPDEVAERLTDADTGLQAGTHNIDFESCYAAVPEDAGPDEEPTSVISTVKAALTARAEAAGWEQVPAVTGSYGPQITTRIPDGEGGFDIEKAVVDPGNLALAARIQGVLQTAITDVSEQVDLNFGHEGADFVTEAEADEISVRELKQTFIYLVSANPGAIAEDRLALLRTTAEEQGWEAGEITQVFETGIDLRAAAQTVTI